MSAFTAKRALEALGATLGTFSFTRYRKFETTIATKRSTKALGATLRAKSHGVIPALALGLMEGDGEIDGTGDPDGDGGIDGIRGGA